MTNIKAELRLVLDRHRGRRQAITRRELRELLVEIQGVWYFADPSPWRMTRLFSEK